MAKTRKDDETSVITMNIDRMDDLENLLKEKEIEIKGASIKDMNCNYSYELLTGPTKGDNLNRRGAHIIHGDLEAAIKNLEVFFAHIDGIFNNWINNQTPLADLEAHEDLQSFSVSGFKIHGTEENESIVLSGTKYTAHGSISFDTPKIKLNGSYLYLDEFRNRIDHAIDEVEAYMNGKTAPESQYEQVAMEFGNNDDMGDDFNDGKVE